MWLENCYLIHKMGPIISYLRHRVMRSGKKRIWKYFVKCYTPVVHECASESLGRLGKDTDCCVSDSVIAVVWDSTEFEFCRYSDADIAGLGTTLRELLCKTNVRHYAFDFTAKFSFLQCCGSFIP